MEVERELQQRRARTQPATETSYMKGLVTAGLLVAATLALSACGKGGEMTPSSEAPSNAATAQAPASPPPAMPATTPTPAATGAAPPSVSTAGSGSNPQH
ncbi:hypothetical protein GCM10028797_29230 [Dyella agri]